MPPKSPYIVSVLALSVAGWPLSSPKASATPVRAEARETTRDSGLRYTGDGTQISGPTDVVPSEASRAARLRLADPTPSPTPPPSGG
jgi:hypothetical protein